MNTPITLPIPLRRVALAVPAVLLALLPAAAQNGTTAYNFLDIAPSAHVYGLGGHNVTLVDDDVTLVEQNPSLLGPEIDKQVALGYMRYIGGSNLMSARYGMGIDSHSAWAVGVQYYGYGSFDGYDASGVSTGTFSARDMAICATYSHDISTTIRGGITVKYISSKYEQYSGSAIGVDLGLNYYDPHHEVSVSLVAKNLGGEVKHFGDKKNKLPWDVQLGISKTFSGLPLRLSLTAYGLSHWSTPYYEPADRNNPTSDLVEHDKFGSNLLRHLVGSVEFLPNDNMFIGIGYNYRTRTDMSTYKRSFLSGFSATAGLRVRTFGFSAAFAQPHTGATTFMLGITTSIGELLR